TRRILFQHGLFTRVRVDLLRLARQQTAARVIKGVILACVLDFPSDARPMMFITSPMGGSFDQVCKQAVAADLNRRRGEGAFRRWPPVAPEKGWVGARQAAGREWPGRY